MHEYGLMADIVAQALEACQARGGREPAGVRVQVSEFAFASRESLETAYEILTRGTPLGGTRVEFVEVAGRASCEACGFSGTGGDLEPEHCDPPLILLCPRCAAPLLITSGGSVLLREVEFRDSGNPVVSGPRVGGR